LREREGKRGEEMTQTLYIHMNKRKKKKFNLEKGIST
jgi:hypothetical protein